MALLHFHQNVFGNFFGILKKNRICLPKISFQSDILGVFGVKVEKFFIDFEQFNMTDPM